MPDPVDDESEPLATDADLEGWAWEPVEGT
jgi:hypothetical protein